MKSSLLVAEEMNREAAGSISRQAVTGTAWTTAQSLLNRISGVVVFLLLARLLEPRAFGLLAAAQIFIALANVFAEAGLARALIQRRTVTRYHLDTAFVISAGSGLVFGIILVLVAPLIAAAFHQPDLRLILQVLAFVPVLAGLESVPDSIARRQLMFRTLALRSSIGVATGAVVAIVLAFLGAGVWSMVAQALVQETVALVLLWTMVRWCPGRRLSRGAASDLTGFSLRVLGIALLNFLSRRTDDFLIGIYLGATALGLYSVAYRLLWMFLDLLVMNVQRVALPVFARLAHEPGRLGNAYLRAVQVATVLAVPAFASLAVLAPQVVPVVFGARWTAAAPVMSALATAGVVQSVALFNNSVLLATGQAGWALRWTAANALANVAVFAATVHLGVFAVACGFSARAWLLAPIGLALVRRSADISLRSQLGAFAGPAMAGLGLVLVLFGLVSVDLPGEPWLQLALELCVGAATYVGILALVGRSALASTIALVRRGRRPPVMTAD